MQFCLSNGSERKQRKENKWREEWEKKHTIFDLVPL